MSRTDATRRDFLCRSIAAGAALSLPYVMTSRSSGAGGGQREDHAGRDRHRPPLYL